MTTSEAENHKAALVPEERRLEFLPSLFGLPLLIVAENTVYYFMEWLSPLDYGGGFWDFYEYRDKPLFMAPTSKPRFRIACPTNGYEGEVSAEAAGIIATLFTFSHLSFRHESDLLVNGYHRLYDHCSGHPESSEISRPSIERPADARPAATNPGARVGRNSIGFTPAVVPRQS